MVGIVVMKAVEQLTKIYKTEDIRALIFLLDENLIQTKSIFKHGTKTEVAQALHKLKGGMKILYLTELEKEVELLEKTIHLHGSVKYLNSLQKLIENSMIASRTLLP